MLRILWLWLEVHCYREVMVVPSSRQYQLLHRMHVYNLAVEKTGRSLMFYRE